MTRIALIVAAVVLVLPAAGAGARPGALVSYARTGGFIGHHDTLSVFRSGAAVSTNGAFKLSDRRLRTLQTALVQARFATLAPRYTPGYPVSDGFTYVVSYGGRSVVVEEEADTPARLQRVLDLLAQILARRG